MRILDASDNEVIDPDLEIGYLVSETLYIDHPPTKEVPEIREEVTIWQNPQDSENKIVQNVVVQKRVAARPAWREPVEQVQRYIPYTPEELAERERQREEAEAAAAAAAAKQARMDALPGEVDDLNEAVAEVGVMTADNAVSNADIMEAVAELGVMVAELTETIKEVSNG